MFKLFSQFLVKRPQPTLDASQQVDQGGLRQGLPATDQLFTFQQVRRRAEWHQPLWVAAIDFKKAFDTVDHSSAWKALWEKGILEQLLTTTDTKQGDLPYTLL